VIQARTGSTRLPGKVLSDLGGRSMLRFMLDRVHDLPVDTLLVATSTLERDDPVCTVASSAHIPAVRGSESDVLERFTAALDRYPADTVVRLTGDCPLVDAQVVAAVIALHERRGADYTSNVLPRTFPRGLDVEVVSASALRAAAAEASDPVEREHVTPFIYRHPERFRLANLRSGEALGDESWTVDTAEDLAFVRDVVGRLGENTNAGWREVLAVAGRRCLPTAGALHLRPAETPDGPDLLRWRNDSDAVRFSGDRRAVTESEHMAWLGRRLDDPSALMSRRASARSASSWTPPNAGTAVVRSFSDCCKPSSSWTGRCTLCVRWLESETPLPWGRSGLRASLFRVRPTTTSASCDGRSQPDLFQYAPIPTLETDVTLLQAPRAVRYCRRCVMPETKPDILFDDDGVCSACRHFELRAVVDWDARRAELQKVLERYRSPDGSRYDCIIPVSGGKDSTYQTIRMLELGMNPLCVTASTDRLSEIGRRNIENIKHLGVDYVEVTANPVIRRRINRLALTQVGDISWPEHVTIFTVPVRVAVQMSVPLIVWGENSQNEYGGPASAAEGSGLTRRWLEEFGGLLGLRVPDLVGQEGIEQRHLIQYTYPTDEELQSVGVTGIFLGYYIPWDGLGNALFAGAHGFESSPHPVAGSFVTYENLDNVQTGIHDYFKFLKYGFGRATDHACMHVRRGRLTRADALKLVRMHDGRYPKSYLGHALDDILGEIHMNRQEFDRICDRFTNKRLFVCDRHGALVRDEDGNLVKVNYDNETGW
jgi:N-acetyl sugar amidotransferase